MNGDAEVVNWLSPPGKPAKGSATTEQKGTVRLRLSNLSISEIAAALSSSARPLQRMNLAGNTGGTIETKWRGSLRNAETAIALDVTAPARVNCMSVVVGKAEAARGDDDQKFSVRK